jgi:hypothetical protein
MTEKEKQRQNFWTDRFSEYLQSDQSTKGNDNRSQQAKFFADSCLAQYDITFNGREKI